MSRARLGVLTSGGDAPGMNAAIAAVAEHAHAAEIEALGFRRGYLGVSLGESQVIGVEDARARVRHTGTWLQSSRYPEMTTYEGLSAIVEQLQSAELAGLVVIGGDGSLQGARRLAGAGVCVAFIPATIDRDVPGTDTSLGHDSAVSYAVAVIQQLRVTGYAVPGRAFVMQTLGGSGHQLAQAVAAAGNVQDLLTSGSDDEIAHVALRLLQRSAEGEAIAVMPEAIGNAVDVAAKLQDSSGIHVHPTILGHAQRAAPTTDVDLGLAAEAGRAAVAAVSRGEPAFIGLDPTGHAISSQIETATSG